MSETSPQGTGEMATSHPLPGPSRTRSQPQVPQQSASLPTPSPLAAVSPPASSTTRRHRAHTVSVSFKPQSSPRRSPAASASSGQSGLMTGLTSEFGMAPVSEGDERRTSIGSARRRGSNADKDKRRRSGSINRRSIVDSLRQSAAENDDRPGTPVSFELEHENEELHDEVVGVLDVIDPQVSTVNHLQNMSNTLIFPHFPALWSRRPEVVLPERPHEETQPLTAAEEGSAGPSSRRQTRRRAASTVSRLFPPSLDSASGGFEPIPEIPPSPTDGQQPGMSPEYPEGTVPPTTAPDSAASGAPGFTSEVDQEMQQIDEEIEKDHHLDAHVKHVLISQSKRDKLRRAGRGLWAFLKTPIGAFTAIYGFLVAFWGAGIVLFLLGWIKTSSKYRQDVWVEICSQVENGLFTLTGIGLIPWRAVDTYRMAKIWHLTVETHKRRGAQGLAPIADPNDLPDPKDAKDYISVLSEKEQEELRYQQTKFSKSQTWYRPHATATHTAFPIKWALWNTILMDGNSIFQCFLCGCMWGLDWHERPAWTTGCLIPLSFLCGIGAGVLIWQGSARTKKTISVQDKLREALDLPIAISGLQRTGDGTVILANGNSAPVPSAESDGETSPKKVEAEKKTAGEEEEKSEHEKKRRWFGRKYKAQDEEKGQPKEGTTTAPTTAGTKTAPSPLARTGETGLDRRATITFGHMHHPDDEGLAEESEKTQGRPRGVTVAAPRVSGDALREETGK